MWIVTFFALGVIIVKTIGAAPKIAATVVVRPRLPMFVMDTFTWEVTNHERKDVSITVFDNKKPLSCNAEVSVRGSSSSMYPKKPYRLELQDYQGNDLRIPLCDMPPESDWILYPSYLDKTFVRDLLMYDLWRAMDYYAPKWKFVELFMRTNAARQEPRPPDDLDTGGEYQGVYILLEKIKRGKDRVDVQKLRKKDNHEPEITGSYIFKRDRLNNPGDRAFKTPRRVELIFEEPKAREITPEQESYLTNYVNAFEDALFGENFSDPDIGYCKYIDVASFVDFHWMMEVSKNVDGYWFSQYYHKDRGGKIKMGPIWDCDMTFGLAKWNECYLTNRWRWSVAAGPNYKWFKRLFEDPDFLQRYIDRWSELRTNILATSNVLARVDAIVAQVRPAIDRNYQRWPTLGKRTGPVYFVGNTYEDEVKYLKDWIEGRLAWIDSEDFPKPTLTVAPKENVLLSTVGLPGTQELRMTCAVGSILYTTDGSDPRLRGGDVSPKAKEYKTPVAIEIGLKIKARVRSEYGLWSAPAAWP
jgi:hypothetical protein